jgi:hypothetical protein
MSYGIRLADAVSGDTLLLDEKHHIRGGTYALGGTTEAWLNITYNYSAHFKQAFGNDDGVRCIYGKTGAESIPILKAAIAKLGDDVSTDYWEPTEGNAKRALHGLPALAQMRPDGVWDGD